MKRFDRKQIVLAGLLVALCALLVGMFPLQHLIQSDVNNIQSALGDQDTDVYLKLFSEFKDPKQYMGIDSSAFQARNVTNLRNPFSMPGRGSNQGSLPRTADGPQPGASLKSLKLGGILWDDTSPAALINNKVVHGSDMVSGFKVLRIGREDVSLQKRGETYTLRLPKKKRP